MTAQPARRPIEPPPGLDPALARFIEELARAARLIDVNAGHVKSKSRANMWYEAWYEPFSLFGKCKKWPFLLVAGEGLEPPTPGL